jgi:energy-coupling factor transport system ATP-binding protein
VIEARAVSICRGAAVPVITDLSLDLAPGERVSLLGRSGSGKSSLFLVLAGLIPPAAGDVQIDGLPASSRPERRHVAGRVGLLFQNPETQLLTTRVADELAFGLEQLGWSTGRIRDRVVRVARELGLAPLLARSPHELSGGELQRVALAAAVAAEPRYLLLDEPTSHLDAESAEEIELWIERTKVESGALVLTADPRPRRTAGSGRAAAGAMPGERHIVLDSGRVVHDSREDLPPGLAGHLAGTRGDPLPVPEIWPSQLTPRGGGCALLARGLDAGFDGRRIVRGVDLEIRAGEVVSLAGRNGAGKSTLLLTLAGLLPPLSGGVELKPKGTLRERVSGVVQFAERLFYRPTVDEELAEWGLSPEASRAALAMVGLDARGPRSPFQLSGGEVRRLALAAGVASCRPILLLDEPNAGLDGPSRAALARMVRAFAVAGGSVVVSSHDPDILALGDRHLRLAAGRLEAA